VVVGNYHLAYDSPCVDTGDLNIRGGGRNRENNRFFLPLYDKTVGRVEWM
jgi:hypothetical protein